MWQCGQDSSGSRQDPLSGFSEHGNEHEISRSHSREYEDGWLPSWLLSPAVWSMFSDVSKVINLRIPQKEADFLTSQITIGFSRPLLCGIKIDMKKGKEVRN